MIFISSFMELCADDFICCSQNTSFLVMQDEYFQVDNSAIKHDGFFVNRGKLERV